MAAQKSEMRVGAEHRLEAARRRLDEVVAGIDGGDELATAIAQHDHRTATREANRLAPANPALAEAWRALDDAVKFYGFALLGDVAERAERHRA